MMVGRFPLPVRAELVEALPFFCTRLEEGKQGFDKLSPNGFEGGSAQCS
jgi:hypothetical protein